MKYKVIRSAAHNFAHSLVSLMNYGPDDYFMGYLSRAAADTGEAELHANLLSGEASPPALLRPAIAQSLAWRVADFPRHLQSHGVPVSRISEAFLRIRLDVTRLEESVRFPGHALVPFECTVEITDDRGRRHVGVVRDVWMADLGPARRSEQPRRWWRFWSRSR